ncbi:MAG: class I tRNA ligase family protein, partial [Candidatus Krumholzibacteria bacterium]|nr:class I tRNA ligase family protein [Candidatus Krumholzibacteria bacterium]
AGTGEGPLAAISDWIETVDPRTGRPARRESNTMPQWAGSCWYYLRFVDPRNERAAWAPQKERYWLPVDLYLGGTEHAVLHLLYARFWHKVLFDLGLVSTPEPFQCLRNQGMILGENGEKMSKSRGNVVNPDDVIAAHGADALRMFLMFLGPLERDKPWNTRGIEGIHRFLDRVWRLFCDESDELAPQVDDSQPTEQALRCLHQCIDAVTDRTEKLLFNTAISQLMVFVNEMNQMPARPRAVLEPFVLLLAPYAPHLAEELWAKLGHRDSLAYEPWPLADARYLTQAAVTYVVQINGKVRDRIEVAAAADEAAVRQAALASEKVQKWLDGKTITKCVFVPGKLLGLVVD